MMSMEQPHSASPEADASESMGLTSQEQSEYKNASEELARIGWVRRTDESPEAFAQRTLKHVDADINSPENKILNMAVPEYGVFRKLANMHENSGQKQEQAQETTEALQAISRVAKEFAGLRWIKPEQLADRSPGEQAQLLIDEFEKNGGNDPRSDNAQFLDPKDEALLRGLAQGRLGR